MAKVVPLASAKAFLDTLEKSGLLAASDLAALRSARGEDSDPKLVARDLVKENKLTKWQAGQLLHGFHQLIVGKYKLMDQIGTGEMGRVYLGEHAQLARKVSLKILSRKYTANPEILKKVLDDGRKASALDHRNLSHVFDVNSEEERYYLVTEFVEGKDLRQLVEASGATSPAQALEIVRQAAEGLEHAHAQGVIHGDLKPSNLIIDPSGIVKVLDLGLSRLTETTPAAGDESTEVATLAAQSFHAPEQSSKHEVSPLVDIYSLGGILFYLLSGKPPLGAIKKAQDVKEACPTVSDELAELCARMLSEDPAARPQSARLAIEALDAAGKAKPKPVAKEEKKPANGEKPQVKQKKPLVAKPLEIPFPTKATAPAAVPATAPAAAATMATADKIEEISLDDISLDDEKLVVKSEPVAEEPAAATEVVAASEPAPASEPASDDPFAGFSLQTKRKKSKPAAAPEAAAAPAPAAKAAPASKAAAQPAAKNTAQPDEAPPTPAKSGKKPSMVMVLVAGIGGGVLILALGVTALVWALSGAGKPLNKAVAKVENKQEGPTTPPVEANPEANPEMNPEENPKVETPPPGTKGPEKTTPAGTAEVPKTTVPMTTPGGTDPVKPPMPMPPMPMPPVTTPMPMPMPPKPEPVKPMPMPEPMVPVGNPFVGFAKTVTLPPLEEKGKPVADSTKPFPLGTIKIPPKLLCLINLKGGDNAISTNAKQKFVMEAANNGTAERDWEIKVTTDGGSIPPVIVAKLALLNDQLNFQWTEDATKQLTSAPYLCNCAFTMSAGMGSHVLALRQPITNAPLKVDLEKPMSAKYTIEYPPNPKQIIIQLGPPEGKFEKFKFDKTELTAKADTTMFSTGPGDEVQLLHFKLVSSMSSKLLKIDALANFKLHLMTKPEKYVKNKMARLVQDTEADSQLALQQQAQLNANLAAVPVDRRAQAEAEAKKNVEDKATLKTQAVMLQNLVKDLQGEGKLHFHILYEADSDTKIVLLSTGAAPPMPAPMP